MEIGRQIARSDRVEIVVVPVDPVDRRTKRFVASLFIGDIADAQPERNLRMAPDDAPGGLERPVDVAKRPEDLEIWEFGNLEISLARATARALKPAR
jgi:hypothetical protein